MASPTSVVITLLIPMSALRRPAQHRIRDEPISTRRLPPVEIPPYMLEKMYPAHVFVSLVNGAFAPTEAAISQLSPSQIEQLVDMGYLQTTEFQQQRPSISYPKEPGDCDPLLREYSKKALPCIICMDRAARTVYVPCGHANSCITCVRKHRPTTCPLCGQALTAVIRLFVDGHVR
jgi:hypothetical protein